MLNNILIVVFLAIVITSIFNLRKAVELTVVYKLLLPIYAVTNIFGLGVTGAFWLEYILIAVFVINYIFIEKRKIDTTFFKPFLVYAGISIILALLGNDVEIDLQFKQVVSFILQEFSLGFIIWHIYNTKKQLDGLLRTLLITIAIICVYGVYCITAGGANPYITFINLVFQPKFDALEVYSDIERGSLQGRLQATTSHPMIWAGFTTILYFVNMFMIYKSKRLTTKLLLAGLLVLITANLVFTGTRSALLAVIAGAFFITIFTSINTKAYLLFGVLLIMLLGVNTSILGKYQDIADSVLFVWNDKKAANYNGSTVGMRFRQLNGAVDIVSDSGSQLFGKGFYWTQFYLSKNGDHPILLAFESVLFVVLIETGFFGVLLWIYWMWGLFKNITAVYRAKRQALGMDYRIIQAYLISYITYILLTGINLTFYFFVIFYVVLLKYVMLNARPQKVKEKKNLELSYEPIGV